MTVPRFAHTLRETVSEMVTGILPKLRHSLSQQEQELRVFLQGNIKLYESLTHLIQSKIEARANSPMPSTPQDCQVSMARDKELPWHLSRMELI